VSTERPKPCRAQLASYKHAAQPALDFLEDHAWAPIALLAAPVALLLAALASLFAGGKARARRSGRLSFAV